MSSWFSDDTQEVGGEVGDTVADWLGDSMCGFPLGGDRFSFRSSFGTFPFLRLIFAVCTHLYIPPPACKEEKKNKKKGYQ